MALSLGYWGAGLSAGVDAYIAAAAEASREEERKKNAEYRDLQAQKLRQSLAAEAALPGNLDKLANLSPETIEHSPAIPGTPESISFGAAPPQAGNVVLPQPPQIDEMTGAEVAQPPVDAGPSGDAMGAGVVPTEVAPAQPGQPSIASQGYTMKGIIKGLGAESAAQLMSTDVGREAIKSKGILSDAEIEKRNKMAVASREAKTLRGESEVFAKAGDMIQHYYKIAAAWEREAEATDDDARRQALMVRAEAARDKAATLQGDPEERRRVAADWQALAPLVSDYRAHPTPDKFMALMDGFGKVQSKDGRTQAFKFLEREAAAVKTQDPDVNAFLQALAKDATDHIAKGPVDGVASVERVMQDNPDLFKRAFPKLAADAKANGGILAAIGTALGLDSLAKTDFQSAYSMTRGQVGLDGERLKPGMPEFVEALQDNLEMIYRAKRAGRLEEIESREGHRDTRTATTEAGKDRRAAGAEAGKNTRAAGKVGDGTGLTSPQQKLLDSYRKLYDSATREIKTAREALGKLSPRDTSSTRDQLERQIQDARDTRKAMAAAMNQQFGLDVGPRAATKKAQAQAMIPKLVAEGRARYGLKPQDQPTPEQAALIKQHVKERLAAEDLL